MDLSALDAWIVLVYLAGMVAVGVWVARRITGFDEFFVAGGRMTTPLLVCTLVSSYYGLDVTFGTSETAFREGMAAFFAYSAPFYVTYVAMAVVVAPRLHRVPARSLPETMGHFYGRGARVTCAIATFVYSAPVLGVYGMGLIGSAFFGLEPWAAASIGAAVALVYTVLGGLLADALTDTLQFTLMCVTVAVAAVLAMSHVGDHDALRATLGESVFTPFGELSFSQILVYASVAMSPLVEPVFYQRTFAARGSREIVRALLIGVALWLAYDWLVVYLGLTGRELVRTGVLPDDLPASAIVLHVADHLLPAGLLGIFLAGCLAAAMSTIDSYALIASGSVVYDAWLPLARRPLSDAALLRATRLGIVPTLVIAVLVAMVFGSIREAWIFMATILLSTALVPMLAALFLLRRPRPRAGTWSAAAGLVTSVGLFVAFLAAGIEDPATESVVWRTPLGFSLQREQSLLVALPVALAAFLAGWLADRAREARA